VLDDYARIIGVIANEDDIETFIPVKTAVVRYSEDKEVLYGLDSVDTYSLKDTVEKLTHYSSKIRKLKNAMLSYSVQHIQNVITGIMLNNEQIIPVDDIMYIEEDKRGSAITKDVINGFLRDSGLALDIPFVQTVEN